MTERSQRHLAWSVATCSLATAIALVLSGPKETAHCTDLHFPNTLVSGGRFGHIDGVDFTGCEVPPTWVWVIATIAVAGSLTWALTVSRRRRT